ncbi:MAG: acetylornithine deacetylase [Devosiaceae bacterium]|nr:acetylornithine deacetylase [Devosiaceae bacterium]
MTKKAAIMDQPATESTLDILLDLVGFDTESSRSNLKLIDYVERYLDRLGVASERVPDPDQPKSSLYARIGPDTSGGVILSGHTDVVPVSGQNWKTNPFELVEKDGRVFGRGSCDMKGFLASVLAAVPKMIKADLASPIYLAFSYDEEVGCTGVSPLIVHLLSKENKPALCIVGEPTMMRPVTAHTGKQNFECTFTGTPMHSSLAPSGVSAISLAAQAIAQITDQAKQFRKYTISDDRFAYPFPTVNFGQIEGGEAVNIVAEKCKFSLEYRYPPGAPENAMRDFLAKLFASEYLTGQIAGHPGASANFKEIVSYPGFTAPQGSVAVEFIASTSGINDTFAVNYGTEAGHFAAAGVPTVVFGPGDIQQAHQPDEYIECAQLTACDQFLNRLIAKLAHGTSNG